MLDLFLPTFDGLLSSAERTWILTGGRFDLAMSVGDTLVFRFYVDGADDPAYTQSASLDFCVDLDRLGLTEGTHTVVVTYVDQYGTESDITDADSAIELTVDDEGAAAGDIKPSLVGAVAITNGFVTITWAVVASGGLSRPASYEIAEAGDPDTILDTVADDPDAQTFASDVGPFDHNQSVTLQVRAVAENGVKGAWVAADAITADAEAPPVPVLIE